MGVAPPVCDFGTPIVDFTLPEPATGKTLSLADVKGENGTLVMFICNHCPYVMAVIDRIVRDAKELQALGVGVVAISANDIGAYPQDAPEHMVTLAEKHGFTFPYLFDESQDVARAYDAVCTPDFFGYNAAGELQYRGRLDESRREAAPADVRRDLFEAMKQVAETGKGPEEQFASIGCSIKWKDAA